MAAEDDEKAENAARSAEVLAEAVRKEILPRRLLTREAFENAMAVVMAVGGSTNAVLHLLAIAHAAEVPLALDDFEEVRARVPVLCDLKPSGRYVATDLHKAGGIPQVMKMLLVNGLLHGDALTITGETVAEVLADVPDEPRADQDVIRPFDRPLYAQGHLAILRGNLAAEGAVAKISGVKHPQITGPARVFDSEEKCLEAILGGAIKPGDVVVIRYEGPKGGPGMREMLAPTSAIIGAGLGDAVAPHHGRSFFGRHVRDGGRARRAGGGGRRDDSARRGRRLDHHRRRGAAVAAQRLGRRVGAAPRGVGRARGALHARRAGEIRAARLVEQPRRGDGRRGEARALSGSEEG